MKLSEIKNEDALDVLADLLDPVVEIVSDEEVKKANENGGKLLAVKVAIKNHKKAIMTILATLDGCPVDEYECNVYTLPMKVMEILNDDNMVAFFSSADGKTE